jgi:hypothetical protein
MRGYVEATEPDEKSGRPKDERQVLSEVVLRDLRIRDATDPSRVLMNIDVGWTIFEKRKVQDGVEPNPWEMLGDCLNVAVSQLVREVQSADLSGRYRVRARVRMELPPLGRAASTSTQALFGHLAEAPPPGWRYRIATTSTTPVGWRGEPRCTEARFEEQQTVHFHRVLGPYRPTVRLWSCPSTIALKFDGRVEFPAVYLGARPDRRRYFLHTIGETNWPDASEQIREHLLVAAPPSRYVFELPADAH